MTPDSQRSEFEFEALEPRLLLSADGLTAAAGMESMIERDLIGQESESAIVVAYAMEPSGAQSNNSGDNVFDVSGQVMEAAVEPSAPSDDSVSQASVEVVSSTDSGATGTEPAVMYSVYDAGSDLTQQLVETLNSSNAPPSEVDGSSSVSSLSSTIDSDGTGALQTQALSVLDGGDTGEVPPTMLADEVNPEEAAAGLADGLDELGETIDAFLNADVILGDRVPILLKTGKDVDGNPVFESPSVLDLLSVPKDANLDGDVNIAPVIGFNDTDDDEIVLAALDALANGGNGNGVVDPGEFLQAWFFNPVETYLNGVGSGDFSDDFVDFMNGSGVWILGGLDQHLNKLSGLYDVEFEIISATNTTQDPDAEYTFSVSFKLTVTQSMPIDLGLSADALKILPFVIGTDDAPVAPKVPVTSTLTFTFDFGIFTGGQDAADINAGDFFVRKAEPIKVSVKSDVPDIPDFSLNIGFLGAKVVNGSLDLQADVLTLLLDPDDPAVLGFTDAQRGVEQTSGSVTADNALAPPADHSAGFFLRIGNLGITKKITVVDDSPGVVDTAGQVIIDIDEALVAAGLGDLVNVSLVGGKVRFDLVSTSSNPLGFVNEVAAQLGVIQATPNGDGPNNFEYLSDQTFLLSVGGALPVFVRVNFADPSHTDIGFNDNQAASVPPLVAPSAPSVFDITGDATFTVTVWKSDGTSVTSSPITLHAADTDGNLDAGELAADIDNAFSAELVYPLVIVEASGGYIRWRALDSSVSAIRVQASGTATSEIGLASDAIIGLQLLGANTATANLSEAAHFKLTLNDNGTIATYVVSVPDNNQGTLAGLAADINTAIDAAIGSDRINVFVSGSQIVLAGNDTNIRSFSVRTINLDIDDLVADVSRALATAGLGGQVTASAVLGQLRLTAAGGKSLEISKTLTFDAGVTYGELLFSDTSELFGPSEGGDSKVHLKLPVKVLPGLYDAVGAVANWDPTGVTIVGNFNPFNSAAAEYIDPPKRFDLRFTYNPYLVTPDSPDQNSEPVAVPIVASLDNKIVLVNFGELLNFNIVSAESMIGLLGGLGSALQQLAGTTTFAGYGIPFADATLSDLLNFADDDKTVFSGLIDILMYDTGGDGVDPASGVVNDHNGLLKWVKVGSTTYLLPAFTTAQKLATTLDGLLDGPLSGLGGINATYHKGTNELTYQLDLRASDRTAVDTTVSLENDVPLTPFAKLAIDSSKPPADTSVALRGRTGLDLTFGVDLSPPGVVIYPSTPLAQLNGGDGIDVSTARALTGATGVRSIFGITQDSKFKISVAGGTAYEVNFTAASTANSTSIDALAIALQGAIDAALVGTPGAGKILVGYDGATHTRIAMKHVDAGQTFQIYVSSSDPLVTEIGFPNKITGGVPQAYEIFFAKKDAPLLIGRLSGTLDATFEIDIVKNRDGSANPAGPVSVAITVASTSGNRSAADLVADVNNALSTAGLLGMVKAEFDNSLAQGTRLVIVAGDDDPLTDDTKIEFTVRATNSKANTELGLPNAATAANKNDFVIYDRAGVAHPIILDPTGLDRANVAYNPLNGLPNSPTVDDLIKVINAWFPDPDAGGPLLPLVVASLNGLHTGLRLITNGAGAEQFRVETINASGALIGIGLFLTGDDDLPDTFNNGDPNLIEGGSIGLTSLDGRFFVRGAQLRIDGLEVKTPDVGVPGQGLYGIIGVNTAITGGLIANVTVALTDPNNSDSKGQITLKELLQKTNTLGPVVVSPVQELIYDGQLTGVGFGEFKVGGLLTTATTGDTAVIVGVRNDTGGGDTSGKLLLAHVRGTFSDNEQIGQTLPVGAAVADANGTPSPAVDFGHFTLKVQVQPGFDDDFAFDADFAALDDAPYTIPFDLTAFGTGIVPPGTSSLDLDTYLGELRPFDKLTYTHFKSVLGDLLDVLQLVEDNFGELTVLLPAINRSVSDLLGLVGPFAQGVNNANARLDAAITAIGPLGKALPALTLQEMGSALRGAFGLPDGVNPAGPGAVNWILFDYDTATDELLLSMNIHEEVSTKLGLDIDPGGGGAHLTSAGVLEVTGNLDVRLNVAISLAVPNNAYLLDTSSISGSLHVQGEGQEYAGGLPGLGMVFRTTAGPLAVFVQDGDALIDFGFALPGLDFGGGATRKLLSGIEWPDFLPKQVSPNTIEIVLPMFYGGEGPNDFIGEYKAIGNVGSVVVTMPPDLAAITAQITGETVPYDPFDNILLAVDTLNLYLEILSDQVSSDILGIKLPFVGDQMADVLFIEDFRTTLVRALKNGIENAINPTPALVTSILNGLFGPGGALDTYVVDGPSMVLVAQNLGGAFNTRYRQWTFTITHSDTITIDDFDIGPDNLGFDIKAPVTVTFDWSIVVSFGVSYGEGAYIEVSDGGELDLDLTMRMPANMTSTPYVGQFGFMQLGVTDSAPASGAKLIFDVDVQNGLNPGPRLGFADLGSMLPVATLSGDGLGTDPVATFHLKTNAAPGLPDLQADFVLDWVLPTTDVATLNGDAVTDYITLIQLNTIKLDAYSAVKKLLGPAFDEIAKFIEPFMPVVDLLTAPIPILSDLAGEPFTILDLAAIFGDVDPRFIEAVADILDVISAVDALANDGVVLPLGSLTLWDTGAGITTFDPGNPAARTSDILVTIGMPGLIHDAGAFTTAQNSDPTGFIPKVRDGLLADGLDMPILTKAEQGIMLLLGNPVATLVSYELPPLGVSFEYLQVFPIWGPLAVSIEINFGFTVDLHAVGFDTYGYKRFADSGFRNAGLIFDGFFFNDAETEGGPDAPEVVFEFGLVGAAELNIGIARAGVGGGIQATINFDWHDSVPDGHVHISELIGNVIAEGGNPLAVFDVSGALTFQMFAFLEISLLGIDEKFPITPETTLFSFNESFDRAPQLATKVGDTLYLNMGPNAIDRLNGDTSDGNETMSLKYEGGDVKVWSVPLGVAVGKAQSFSGIKHIVGIGGEGNDTITLDGFDGSKITGDFDGGVGDDRIEYINTSASNSWAGARIVGGLGNDTLTGGDANDVIYGGDGNDLIKGSGGYDILFGDHGRVADTAPKPFISSRITVNDGADDIDGGAGDDVIFGAGGSDKLKGGAGNDLLIGDGGRFEYTTTGGHINVNALRPPTYVPAGAATWKDPAIISAEIDALQDFVLVRVRATELGLGGNDVIEGGGDDDLILGGSGDDDLKGDGGADFMLAGKGFDLAHGNAGNDVIFGGDQADILNGDGDDDVMAGGAGNDYMHGDAGHDVMKGDTGADIMFGDAGDDQVFGLTEPDVLFGGLDNDLVVGGTGSDIMFGDDGLVAKLHPVTGLGLKVIGIGFGGVVPAGQFFDGDKRTVDLILTDVVAGDGNDMMSGDAGDDIMLGGGGNDLMGGDVDPRLPSAGVDTAISEDVLIGDGGKITFNERRFRSIATVIGPDATGAPFNDVIYGDNGNDYIFGGRGSDFLFGGHGKQVTLVGEIVGAFRGATDVGAADNDIIVGDNGEMFFADGTIPDNYGRLELVRTTDVTDATGGHEYAEGELGNDVIFGGVNGSVDVLFGSAGDDVILGDNGELDFALGADVDLDTLDLIRSYRDALGGIDHISGDAGNDVLIGGTAGDLMYGDDAAASHGASDGEDIMLGDNADIFLIGTVGRLKVKVATMTTGTAVDIIKTTDAVDLLHPTKALAEAAGGADTMSGNAGNDIMLGGVNNDDGVGLPEVDTMFGDRAAPNATTIANDGNDILLGDNGELDFTYLADTDRMTLDLIRSYQDALGGTDIVSGNKGLDVAIGGTSGDTIYGDDSTASAAANDLADILLGDNADIFLVAVNGAVGADLKVVLSAAVKTIRTTDNVDPVNTGGIDTISGNAGSDIIAGGVYGDFLYGDRQVPNATTSANDGNDIILGDNGALEWLSTGRLDEILGIDIAENNADLWAKYGTNVADANLGTLDLITTEQPTSGGRDNIYGDEGSDLVWGGTDLDVIRGDDGDEAAETVQANRDVLFGDHGRLYPQFSRYRLVNSTTLVAALDFHARNFFAIDTGNTAGGEGDTMWGEEGDDIMVGQQGDDRMWGGSGNDDMVGGHNVAGGYDELSAPAVVATLAPLSVNDLIDGGTDNDSIAGDNAIVWRRNDDFSPRFRILSNGSTKIYTTGPDGVDTIVTNIDGIWHSDPDDVVGRDIQLVDHSDAVEANPLGRFGADVIAGGAHLDTIFGQLGNDLIQGDGSISTVMGIGAFVVRTLGVTDSGINPDTDETLYFNVPEAASDGNDYIEGNGGSDLIYGGLGQDDILGGNSDLFGLNAFYAAKLGFTAEQLRPDGSDIIFGGAGLPARLVRNDFVGSTDTALGTSETTGARPTNDDPSIALADRHSRDADFILGDNANIFRLVTVNPVTDAFLQFNYDQTTSYENRGSQRIIVRAMVMLDYTLGGADYEGGTYVSGAAVISGVADNGAADLIHGESGDDYIFGQTGSDALYGESDDDDIVGGYGHDWISGGTGQDGVLGDDGLLYTSRNSTLGEPLYGVAPLLANDPSAKYSHGNVLDELISTPGDIQIAQINPTGALKKTADLVPFSFDATWLGMDDEFPDNADSKPFADDIIFGGLDSDFLHGGSGDDAVSGAEALVDARVPTFDNLGVPNGTLNLGYGAFQTPININPGDTAVLGALAAGDWLAFNPVDTDGQHLNNRFRAGEFFLYDEYDPRRKIMLDSTGNLWKSAAQGVAYEFVLNFNGAEGLYRPAGTVPKATGQQTESYPVVNDDGKDAIFGDNGNDWIVGGTGRDNIYGGWGNDLLNADDKHDINDDGTKENTVSDTHPTFEDRAYGGAGRDILIGNTGGDRLIDWVGEYNSYLVPYAPFGQASVSRTLQPFLPEFLYALSAGDGADFTRYTDAFGSTPPAPTNNNPNPSRNGEPNGELGLVLQKDYAWQDQTGAPADPQAGNIPGGHRDVLRTAGFNDGSSDGFFADSGSWVVKSGVLTVEPAAKGGDALSVFYVDDFIPSYFEILATLNAVKPTAGFKSNAYIVFDYQSETDFKFAGIDVSNSKLVIGQRTDAGWTVVKQGVYPGGLKSATNYNVFLALNGSNVTLIVDNKVTLTYTFASRIDAFGIAHGLHDGMVGLGADNAKATIDNMIVQRLAPVMTFVRTVDFSSGLTDLFDTPSSGTWSLAAGRYAGAVSGSTVAINLLTPSPAPAALIDLSTVLSTTGTGGLVFDYYNPTAFKFATIDRVAGTVTLGHRTSKGWFTDAVYTNAAIKTSSDQSLGVTIKGTTVSVKWNNSLVISFVFNALATDGATGLLGRVGSTSFNEVKFQTDDPGIVIAQAGVTPSGSSASAAMVSISTSEMPLIGVMPDAYPAPVPAIATVTTFAPQGPVNGSIAGNLLGSTASYSLVSGFSGTGSTLIPMITTGVSIAGIDTIPALTSLHTTVASGPVRLIGGETQSWTLASVKFDSQALSTSAAHNAALETQPAPTDSGDENTEASEEIQAMSADSGVESIFDMQAMPPTSHGAVESRKSDEAQPDSEDGSEPGRPQPDAI